MQAELQIEQLQQAINDNLRPSQAILEEIEDSRKVLAQAIEAVQRYQQRSRLAQVAIGLFDGLAGAFLALSALLFFQESYSIAFGLLGPAAASLVGAIAFRSRRIPLG